MTRSDLIRTLTEKMPHLALRDVETAVKQIFEDMTDCLGRGGRIEIRGFGSFSVRYRSPRIARNPKTGEKLTAPGKYTAHFKTGKELKERVNASMEHYPIKTAEE